MSDEPGSDYRRNVGLLLLDGRGWAWVGRRLDGDGASWQLPQGGIDAGEHPADAAMRELEEEIGTAKARILFESETWLTYDLPPDLRAKVWGGKWRGQAQRWFALAFTGTDADIDIRTKHPEFGAWRWVPRTDLPDLIVAFKRPVYTAMLAAFEPKLRALGY